MSRPDMIASDVPVPSVALRAVYAHGASVRLSNGRDYLDLMNGKGSITLGHHHPAVTEVISANLRDMTSCVSCWTDPFEALSAQVVADSGIPDGKIAFFSTGTEACRAAVECARGYTGRRLIASAGYHGWGALWQPAPTFLEPNAEGVVDFFFVPELLEQVLARYRDHIALVMISPDFVHLRPDTLRTLIEMTRAQGILVCSDDVKNGYRSVPASALPSTCGVSADLYTFSKGLANGQRLSCLVGPATLMRGTRHFVSTTYLDVLPVVAALATLHTMRTENGYSRLVACGAELARRLRGLATSAELPLKVFGDGPLIQLAGASEDFDAVLYALCAENGLLLYDFDNQAVSLATETVLVEIEARFSRVFSLLADRFRPLLGTKVSPRRQFDAALRMIDGATDAFGSTTAIRWLEAQSS